jgi:hypothetical protein
LLLAVVVVAAVVAVAAVAGHGDCDLEQWQQQLQL